MNEKQKGQGSIGGTLGILASTVFLDLVGFGMIVPTIYSIQSPISHLSCDPEVAMM